MKVKVLVANCKIQGLFPTSGSCTNSRIASFPKVRGNPVDSICYRIVYNIHHIQRIVSFVTLCVVVST